MKTAGKFLNLLAVGAAFLSASANATSPVVIAELNAQGGLSPIGYPIASGVRVLDTGAVVKYDEYQDSTKNTEVTILTLSMDRVRAIRAYAKDFTPETLVDSDPSMPPCADVPTSTYYATNSADQRIAFKREAQCHVFLHPTHDGSALAGILSSFLTLARSF